jgi:outer membrane protein TolC
MMFSQGLPFPGKLRLAGRIAESEAQQLKSALPPRTALSLEARVRRAYYDLVLARAQLELIDDRQRTWQQIEGVVRERYAVGLGVQQDLVRTQIELVRLDESRADQQAVVVSKLAELNRLISRPQDTAVETRPVLTYRPEVPPMDQVIATSLEKSPELAAAREAIQTSKLSVDFAKLGFLPDFVVSGGPMLRGSMTPMWQAGVGISVPLYFRSRQQKRLEETQALRRSSEAQQTSLALELELRTRERIASLGAAQRVIKLYKEGVLPLDQLSLDAGLASYRTGKVPFVSVLEALNALYADKALYLSRLADAEKWRVAIDEADLQPTAGMPAPSGMGAALSTAKMNASATPENSSGAMK